MTMPQDCLQPDPAQPILGLPWPLQVESLGDNPTHPWTCWPASGSGPSVSITGLTRGWRTPVTLAPDLSVRRGCRAETWTRAGRAGTPATMPGTAAQPPQPSQRPIPGASGDCGVIMTRPASISPRQLGSHASRGLALCITATHGGHRGPEEPCPWPADRDAWPGAEAARPCACQTC